MMISLQTLEHSFREMLRIRLFEERVRREFGKGDMPGFVHVYVGAEAIAVGVCSQLEQTDMITSTHRGHGHCLAKGVEIAPMVAELYGREAGLCHGRGGSMHIADFSKGVLGANAIVGGGIGIAVGAALAAQTLKDGRVAVTFFGDGAANQGVLHESMNLASIWKLPVVFVCENNGWAESTPASYSISVSDVAIRAAGYSIPGVVVDATDYSAMHVAAEQAILRARMGNGPSFIEAKFPRQVGHFVGDGEAYRSRDDRKSARQLDVIARTRLELESRGVDVGAIVDELGKLIGGELDSAFAAARDSKWPNIDELESYVYSN
ncbi:MAG: thiamine pyrophosphate-dependent dehydrogenase E1 component subunit alpha [Acidimicrobiaceae bacterium]|nr:thiamine pyrophosphate-dependent dehydrogenase E1 component subunit alpha [Acidimicrobiaceae bacterium]